MRLMNRQRGTSVFTVMSLLVLVGFVAIFVIKLVPVYIENFTIRSVMSEFRTEQTKYANALNVQESLRKRFDVNNIRGVNPGDVEVAPADGGGYALHLDYEVQVPFIGNIVLLVKFSEDGHAHGGSESL